MRLSNYKTASTLCFLIILRSLNWCEGCLDEERSALLQIKDSVGYRKQIHPWALWAGDNCCQWIGVLCQDSSASSSHVVLLYLGGFVGEGLVTWHPNATLFAQFTKLESLYLSGNHIGGWVMPHGFSVMKSLKELVLGGNRLNESISSLSGLCRLRNLQILDLSYNNLHDSDIPTCLLHNSSELEVLYLDFNKLGSLDGFARMESLRNLSVWGNRLNESSSSLSGLCGLINLRKLDLRDNGLHDANLPPCLCGLGNIKQLYLSYNNLDGQNLLQCLNNLSSLQMLALDDNTLGDKFSISQGSLQLPNFKTLYLSGNRLTDRNLGSWITNLTSLVDLYLSRNNLKSSRTLTGLCTLKNLRTLSLYWNSFVGQIPTCFKDIYSLQSLDLSFNQFNGSIHPSIFSNLTMIQDIVVSNNQLNGAIPFSMFANLSMLTNIDLSSNVRARVETEHPHWTPTFQLSELNLTGCNLSSRSIPSFLSSQQHLSNFEADYSFLSGAIPHWLLYNVTNPLLLSLRGNMLHGPFPQSSQEKASKLAKLDISNNTISGTLPTNIGALLPNLIYFSLSTNALQGNIPLSIDGLAYLEVLDLSNNNFSGEIPLGLTKNKASLKYLLLSNNSLEGEIFTMDSNISELLVLSLDDNLFSGTISQSLSNSLSLMFLDFRNNRLSGTIPSWFSSLSNLVSILLSGNSFTGQIPRNFCQIQNLHTLDLKNNSLSGSIPSCLKNITSLVKKSPISEQFFSMIGTLSKGFIQDIKVRADFTTKGQVYSYEGIPLTLMTGLDLSMNRLIGKIPLELGDLRELCSLNLSNNLLTGSIPPSLKYLTNLESLDLSHNKLNGLIPLELTQMSSLSSFSVAFNNLSGQIPSERQFSTFNQSSFEGNVGLCGPLIRRTCSSDDPSQPHDDDEDKEVPSILDRSMLFYLWVLLSFALGFSSFVLVLIFNTNWRRSYFKVTDKYIDSIVAGIIRFSFYVKK